MADVLDEHDIEPPQTSGSHHRWLWLVAVAVIAVTAFVLFWFQPQKLFIPAAGSAPR
jgi:hypothetical protein